MSFGLGPSEKLKCISSSMPSRSRSCYRVEQQVDRQTSNSLELKTELLIPYMQQH